MAEVQNAQEKLAMAPKGIFDGDGALIRIGASTTGCAAVGVAIGSLVGPSAAGVGGTIGGVIGFVASTVDNVISKIDK